MATPPSEEEILQLVAERESLRQSRRFAESDEIRDQLRAMGVELYDKEREWRARDGRRGVLFTAGPQACTLTDAEIHDAISQREEARTAKDWTQADSLRNSLRAQGVELNDKERSWRTATGRSGTYTAHVNTTASLSLSEGDIRGMVAEREQARANKDYALADELRKRLSALGVELFDNERLWKASDGRQGVIVTGGAEIVQCSLTDHEIQSRIRQREEARSQRDFDHADTIRADLRRNGVELVDAEHLWRATDGRMGYYSGELAGTGHGPDVLPKQHQTQLNSQVLRASSLAQAYVAQHSSGSANSRSEPYASNGGHQSVSAAAAARAASAGAGVQATALLSDAAIEALVQGREVEREQRNWVAADEIRQDLRKHGVEVWDKQGTWKCTDGRHGTIESARGGADEPQVAGSGSSLAALEREAKRTLARLSNSGNISADLAAVLALAGRIGHSSNTRRK